MAAPVKCSMPDNVDIDTSYTLQIAALDPTTGNAVSGVTFSNMSIEAVDLSAAGDGSGLETPTFALVPGPGS